MESRHTRKLIVAILLLLAAAGAWLLAGDRADNRPPVLMPAAPRAGATPILWTVPPFAFPDQDNKTISKRSLQGKIWIVSFLETECRQVCPKMSSRMAALQKELDDPRVLFVSFSIDPQRDTQAARKAYGATYQLDPARWHFLAPPDRDIALRIASALKVAGAPGPQQFTMIHQDRFVLIDEQGRARGAYPEPDPAAMTRLVEHVRELLELPPHKNN